MRTFRYRNELGAVRIRLAGKEHLSVREADRYGELLRLQQSGKIRNLEVHPARIPAIRQRRKKVLKPAFKYIEKGKTVVELVRIRPHRSEEDAVDQERFGERYPEITIRYT